MIKTCSKCQQTKDQKKWHGRQCTECILKYRHDWAERSKEYLANYHSEYARIHSKEATERATKWAKDNPGKRRQNALAYYYRLQDEAVNAYGGYRCACCGETV